ncbi:sporulation protein [Pseudoalteromonas aurantia]|uniref:Sporulation protein n=1 Tax=Pseudoalteromonas aurantia TaxID=43654 RepID=A0A5S3VE48_9GAMM|nr:sporulation protein [Pseudoalteromonas aurantia]TMO60273.1 sporulation protein [Pseudoalteromonas aurantia]TMO70627.1 sporulation protein [Pseudoalteromonas aurantia]TMO74920.1 sporulation protein [Pseudoalteromonas aurantia]
MSFFKKVLGTVGIGAAKVDAILEYNQIAPGEEISGTVKIVGGKIEQEINKIDLNVVCNYTVEKENDDGESVTINKNHTLAKYHINESFTISPSEEKLIPFAFDLALEAPITVGQSRTWLTTNLDIDMALDKSDKDFIHVTPTELQQAVIDSLEELGFKLYESDCEGIESASFSRLPFVQELEFKTISGDFHGRFDEVEIVFFNRGEQLEVIFEIDRKAKGLMGFFAEALDLDESNARLVVTEDDIEDLEDHIYTILEANS